VQISNAVLATLSRQRPPATGKRYETLYPHFASCLTSSVLFEMAMAQGFSVRDLSCGSLHVNVSKRVNGHPQLDERLDSP
jgi:hypothetical protein